MSIERKDVRVKLDDYWHNRLNRASDTLGTTPGALAEIWVIDALKKRISDFNVLKDEFRDVSDAGNLRDQQGKPR